jgi:CubicO group peptidase (beta-lactamase class C family)
LAPARPEAEGFSAGRLARITHLFQEYVDQDYIAGAAALIARNGKIIYYEAVGFEDPGSGKPLEKDAIFRVASQTKAITSVAVMMLYEEGELLLDDTVSKYLPEFSEQDVLVNFDESDSLFIATKARRQVTIRDLLTHTSGYGYPGSLRKAMKAMYEKYGINVGMGAKGVLKEEMQTIAMLPLAHQPGGPDKFGLGFEIISPPGDDKIPINEGAYGWGGAFGSLYWIDPGEELIAHLVIQKVKDYGEIRAKFINAVYQALED